MTGTNHTAARGAKRLLASIHDVHPGSIDTVERLAAQFERHLGGPRYAMIDRTLAAFTRQRGAGRCAGLLAP